MIFIRLPSGSLVVCMTTGVVVVGTDCNECNLLLWTVRFSVPPLESESAISFSVSAGSSFPESCSPSVLPCSSPFSSPSLAANDPESMPSGSSSSLSVIISGGCICCCWLLCSASLSSSRTVIELSPFDSPDSSPSPSPSASSNSPNGPTSTSTPPPARGRYLIILRDELERDMDQSLTVLDTNPEFFELDVGLVSGEVASVNKIMWKAAQRVLESCSNCIGIVGTGAENDDENDDDDDEQKDHVKNDDNDNEEHEIPMTDDREDVVKDKDKDEKKIHPANDASPKSTKKNKNKNKKDAMASSADPASLPAIHFVGNSLAGGVASLAASILDGSVPMPKEKKQRKRRHRSRRRGSRRHRAQDEIDEVDKDRHGGDDDDDDDIIQLYAIACREVKS
mmetsp:Transcript_17113/g.24893  ORF Transcript_17113/g.24893 Transcript_17113/m.24893 type:complete len:395 (+) Transcript_17113:266-1450(+)